MAALASEFGPELIALEYYSSGEYACNDARAMFDKYVIPRLSTPQTRFNGSSGTVVSTDRYIQYKEQIEREQQKQQNSKSRSMLLSGNLINASGKIRVNVDLTNLSDDILRNASLYAVLYESVTFDDGSRHNIVVGVTQAIAIDSLGVGNLAKYQLQHDLAYSGSYGAVIMLTLPGEIARAYQIK